MISQTRENWKESLAEYNIGAMAPVFFEILLFFCQKANKQPLRGGFKKRQKKIANVLSKLSDLRHPLSRNNKKRSHTQLDSRKQVIAFQDRVMTINIKEAQHPLKREKQVIDKSSIMLKISTKSMHRVLV